MTAKCDLPTVVNLDALLREIEREAMTAPSRPVEVGDAERLTFWVFLDEWLELPAGF